MSDENPYTTYLEYAVVKLRDADPNLKYKIIGNVLNLSTNLTEAQASDILFNSIHPLRALPGFRYVWLPPEKGPSDHADET